MKKQIEQLLSGKFKYDQPQLLFSKEKLSVTLEAGKTARGELYLGTEDNDKIKGYITSSTAGLCRETAVSQERPCAFHTELTEPGCSREKYAQDGCV